MGHIDPYNKNQIRDKLFLVLILLRACKDRKQCRTRTERTGEKMEEMYFTITGCNHYLGNSFMEKGMKIRLEKEPDNEYDKEAIQVKVKGLGKVGYVANSPFTVKGESMSAGRLYDKIGDAAKAKIVHVVGGGAVCRITDACRK